MNLTPPQRRSLTWAGLALAAFLLLWLLAPVLTPFIVGAVLAYALHPAVERLAARRVPRLLAVLGVEVLFIVAVLAVLLLIVPIISKELPLLREQIPILADKLNRQVLKYKEKLSDHRCDRETIERTLTTAPPSPAAK